MSETWRDESEEAVRSPYGDVLYLSGGSCSKGVGICVSKRMHKQMSNISFHAISPRICMLVFQMAGRMFHVLSCYFPTCWDPVEAVEELYGVTSLLLEGQRSSNAMVILGGDFNACVGAIQAHDDEQHVGPCGEGNRNDRGSMLVRWIMSENLQLLNRMTQNQTRDGWTCQRYLDGMRTQIDFLLGPLVVEVERAWNDFCIPIGIDHRCVHCVLRIPIRKGRLHKPRRVNFKGWSPHLNEFRISSIYHEELNRWTATTVEPSFDSLEAALFNAGLKGGSSKHKHPRFIPSPFLRDLRHARRTSLCVSEKRRLSLQIRKVHAKELSTWKSRRCAELLRTAKNWKTLRTCHMTPQQFSTMPPVDDFAEMLSDIFSGTNFEATKPSVLEELPFTMRELDSAIHSLKSNKASDECGLAAELLHHTPPAFREVLLNLYNHVLATGEVPSSWKKTFFKMLAKSTKAKLVTDYRPIVTLRLLYKTFSYMVLCRIEPLLEVGQPEEQHGFRQNRRLEEHLLTTNIVIDTSRAYGVPIWVLSLDLSKAFDRVDWQALWLSATMAFRNT